MWKKVEVVSEGKHFLFLTIIIASEFKFCTSCIYDGALIICHTS